MTDQEVFMPKFTAGPPTIIYKTKGDYHQNVPIILSPDKSSVASFPGPGDLFFNDGLALPIQLDDGWLLDVRGINENVAFLDITYADYSKLTSAPGVEQLMEMILDADPLIAMYHCGNRHQYNDLVNQLNSLIAKNGLENCRKLK